MTDPESCGGIVIACVRVRDIQGRLRSRHIPGRITAIARRSRREFWRTGAADVNRPPHRDPIAWTGSGTPGIRRHIKQPDEYARRHRGAAKAKC